MNDDIRPWDKNPRYWQYKGEPVLLLGGSDGDNLYQMPDAELRAQLDLLRSVGGNCIRNVMSCRDKGDAWMFGKNEQGQYDLDLWNDEHWRRFENLLKWTHERDIIVQIEVWAFHDFNDPKGPWGDCQEQMYHVSPWNPANNVNLNAENTQLKERYGSMGKVKHDFFFSVPALNNDTALLGYQQKFVDKLLSYAQPYGHVLYCMTNEIHPQYSHEWGWYWATYIRDKAREAGKQVYTSEMFWQPDLTHEQHRPALEHPEVYSFFEASQNSAREGQLNWDQRAFVYEALSAQPRPMNNTKIYGSEHEMIRDDVNAKQCFWRNIIGGCASSRFHRPPCGLGLGAVAQANIRSMRMLTEELNIFDCTPHNDLLSDRAENGAYCTANPGTEYAVYFPAGGTVTLDLSAAEGELTARWLDIGASAWGKQEKLGPGQATLVAPADAPRVVLIK